LALERLDVFMCASSYSRLMVGDTQSRPAAAYLELVNSKGVAS